MERSGTLEKSQEFTRIVFALQIEVSGIKWNHWVISGTFQNK